ncbi:MAG: methyltransferase domain-containing protein [Candidatus Firestonebacteria bacterium]|nr:methyltransferase domain-containing protein [Candidatus Firestonebacteria bacterium]
MSANRPGLSHVDKIQTPPSAKKNPAVGRPARYGLAGVKAWFWPNADRRERWVRAQLAQLPAGSKLLDVGAGEQPYRRYCPQVRYFAQDSGEYRPGTQGLQIAGWQYGRLDYRGNAWEISEKKAFFDALLCTEVLEHIPYPNETLIEFGRLLKPGGTLLLTVPYAALPHMQPQFFFSGFSQEYFRYFLTQAGFAVEEISSNGTTGDYLFQEVVRLGLELPLWARALYWPAMLPPLALLKLLALVRPQAKKLVFGYHIRARKKGVLPPPDRREKPRKRP